MSFFGPSRNERLLQWEISQLRQEVTDLTESRDELREICKKKNARIAELELFHSGKVHDLSTLRASNERLVAQIDAAIHVLTGAPR